jgi:hypothetical protein
VGVAVRVAVAVRVGVRVGEGVGVANPGMAWQALSKKNKNSRMAFLACFMDRFYL